MAPKADTKKAVEEVADRQREQMGQPAEKKSTSAPAKEPETVDPGRLMAEREQEREQARRQENESRQAHYVRLVMVENPTKAEAEALVDVAGDLGKTAGQLADDRRIASHARRAQDLADRYEEVQEAEQQAKDAYAKFVEQVELEHAAHELKFRHASHEKHDAHSAKANLVNLRRQRPAFFTSDDPPRLITQ